MDWSDVIRQLKRLVKKPVIDWAEVDPWVIEALRGSVLETGWRRKGWKASDWKGPSMRHTSMYLNVTSGRVSNYFDEPDKVVDMAKRAVERLVWLDELGPVDYPGGNKITEPIGLGTLWWDYNPKVIQAALDCDIRFFDTSETYGYGHTEKALGEVLDDEEVIVATRMSRSHVSYKATINAAGRSIDRLRRSLLLYQAHRYSLKYPITDMANALKDLKSEGKVDVLGVSCYSVDQVEIAQHHFAPYNVSSVQVRYNLVERGIERSLLPFCQERGIVVIAYSPLCQNFKNLLGYDEGHVLESISKKYGATPAQVVLAWLMSHEWVLPIPKTNKIQHVQEIADSINLVLDGVDVEEIEASFPIID